MRSSELSDQDDRNIRNNGCGDLLSVLSLDGIVELLSGLVGRRVEVVTIATLKTGVLHDVFQVTADFGDTCHDYVIKAETRQEGRPFIHQRVIDIPLEFEVLSALASMRIPVPKPLGMDQSGTYVGARCLIMEKVEGHLLDGPLWRRESHAVEMYTDAVVMLSRILPGHLGEVAARCPERGTAVHFLDWIGEQLNKVVVATAADEVFCELMRWKPPEIPLKFSNGDLNPTNFLADNQRLLAVLDFEHAGFSDPILEVMRPLGTMPDEILLTMARRYCQVENLWQGHLRWYKGLLALDRWLEVAQSPSSTLRDATDDSDCFELRKWLAGD